jgi:hypothetical protein
MELIIISIAVFVALVVLVAFIVFQRPLAYKREKTISTSTQEGKTISPFTQVGTIKVPAKKRPFAVNDPDDPMKYILGGSLPYPTDSPQKRCVLTVNELTRLASTHDITKEIGNLNAAAINFSELLYALRLQSSGEHGALTLRINYFNIAIVNTNDGNLRIICCTWSSCFRDWVLQQIAINQSPYWQEIPYWRIGTRVISRQTD